MSEFSNLDKNDEKTNELFEKMVSEASNFTDFFNKIKEINGIYPDIKTHELNAEQVEDTRTDGEREIEKNAIEWSREPERGEDETDEEYEKKWKPSEIREAYGILLDNINPKNRKDTTKKIENINIEYHNLKDYFKFLNGEDTSLKIKIVEKDDTTVEEDAPVDPSARPERRANLQHVEASKNKRLRLGLFSFPSFLRRKRPGGKRRTKRRRKSRGGKLTKRRSKSRGGKRRTKRRRKSRKRRKSRGGKRRIKRRTKRRRR